MEGMILQGSLLEQPRRFSDQHLSLLMHQANDMCDLFGLSCLDEHLDARGLDYSRVTVIYGVLFFKDNGHKPHHQAKHTTRKTTIFFTTSRNFVMGTSVFTLFFPKFRHCALLGS